MTGWVPDPPDAAGALPPAGEPADIRILWDNLQGIGDWALAQGDVLTGQDLETACLTSLFSDALATPDFVPTDGTTDRRGWWADTYLPEPLGSNLWQLDRAKTTRANLGLARNTAQRALQWLVDDGVAASVNVDAQWATRTRLLLTIRLLRPNGSQTRFMFGWAWDGLLPWPNGTTGLPPPPLPPPTPVISTLQTGESGGFILTPAGEMIGVTQNAL